jgi:transposase
MFVQDHHTLEELQQRTKTLTKKRIWLRHQAVVLAKRGHSAPEIAQALGCSRRAVQTWVAQYNQGGVPALQERPHTGRPPRLAAADVPRFRDRLEAGPTPEDGVCTFRCQDLRRILEEEFGVSLRRQAIYDLLHRLDYSSLMPRPQHEQANPEVQEFFKEIVVEQIDAIAAAHPEEEIHTYFQDEARFGQKGTITRVWARRGSRPRAVRQTGFTSLYVLAAVCAATGAMSAVIMPTLNTEVVNLFLEQFSQTLAPDEHAAMIWDGAGFHVSRELQVPANVTIIQLPPYSPELNPIENLWHYLKSHFWSNRAYADYEELEQAAVHAWRQAVLDADLMKTVCNAPYAKGATSS